MSEPDPMQQGTPKSSFRTLVAEDHKEARILLAERLARMEHVDVVGTAGPSEVVEVALELGPNLVICSFPSAAAAETAVVERIAALPSAPKVFVYASLIPGDLERRFPWLTASRYR